MKLSLSTAIALAACAEHAVAQTLAHPGARSGAVVEASLSGELLYTRASEGTWQIWLRDLDTGDDVQLTHTPGDKRYPCWTHDGRVAYQSVNQECWVLDPEGGEPQPVLKDVWPVRDVVWSPAGPRIAYARIRTDVIDAANVFTANLDGSDRRALTNDPGIQYTPSWSPDGARIAFVSGDGWGTYDVWTMRADGAELLRLPWDQTHEFLPAWSPDGARLALASDRTGDFEIWVARPDGGEAARLTHRAGLDTRPVWSPDGAWIAFTRSLDGEVEIAAVRADGSSEAHTLVRARHGARDPAWRSKRGAATAKADADAKGAATALEPLFVREAAASRKTFDPSAGESVTLSFATSHAGRVMVDIVDEAGAVVRRLRTERAPAGAQSFVWDGRDGAGELAKAGVHRYVVQLDDATGRKLVFDPAQEPWGEELRPERFEHDAENGVLTWSMPKAGFARVRVALRNFPLLATLLDWAPLEAGPQQVRWDGFDESSHVELRQHPDLWITLELYGMPDNALIVRSSATALGSRAAVAASAPVARRAPLIGGPQAYREARKPRELMLAPRVDLEFLGASDLDAAGREIVRGITPVRVTVDPRDVASLTDAMFEVALYVDLNFFFEEEESTTPLTYLWDTSQLTPGPHLLTVNVFSYDGRIGTLTRSVIVGEPR
jgi:WD40 repeat protein